MLFSESIDVQYVGYRNKGFMATITYDYLWDRGDWIVQYGVVYPPKEEFDIPTWRNSSHWCKSYEDAEEFCKEKAKKLGFSHMISDREWEQLVPHTYHRY